MKDSKNTVSLHPLGNRVLIEPSDRERKTAGGIILPDNVQKKPTEGIVVAVGPGSRSTDGTYSPMAVNPGDKVIYSKYGGTEITNGDKEYTILDEDQIYAVLEREKK